jgi:2-polyprenyl-3-methyl-5-hydroxy-6-metoxy-1,4-benzoquinol methylase
MSDGRINMWDERYSAEEYAYGITPNKFLEQNVHSIPKGRVLSLAEGEGRNAVFLAKRGYFVTAVDASIE